MIALTYDDGPYIYTSDILDILSANNVPATFFITGNNLGKGEIDNAAYPWSSIIQRMHADGHQIASHTWSHQDLSNEVTHAQRLDQMYYNEMALRNILGFFPTYMRPPYSSCTSGSGCESDMGTLGYHITYFDLDTEDYLNDSPTKIQTSKNDFSGNLSSSNPATDNWLVIGHDIHEQTAHNLTQFMITYAKDQGWTFGTVGQCLGDPEANWYRSSSGSVFTSTTSTPQPTATSTTTSNPGTIPTEVSLDGTCGGSSGYTCQGSSFGDCCSQYGWCGSTTNYCDTGCQSEFGTCGSSGTATTTTSSSGSSSTLAVSLDGTCGGTSGNTCQGSTFGDCCSQYGWCGSTSAYCSDGCQTSSGTCN
jgi:peptidoglycan/xylan/chitin deacetylase (PgdA/CDA1 family)